MMNTLWNTLVQPHSSLSDEQQREKARLFASILLVTLPIGFAILWNFSFMQDGSLDTDADVLLGWSTWFLNLLGYLIMRFRGKFNLLAGLYIAEMAAAFVIGGHAPGSRDSLLIFAIVPVTLTALFFTRSHVLLVASAILLSSVVLTETISDALRDNAVFYNMFIFLMSGIVLTFVSHLQRLETIRQDELMATNRKLQESEALLEKRVNDRTRDLELAATVSRQAATVLDPEVLLRQIVEQTRQAFDMSYVALFLSNQDGTGLSFKVGSPASQDDRAAAYVLSLECPCIVTRAANRREAVMVNDVTQDADYIKFITETHSELAIPLITGNVLLGVLDMQSDRVNRFDADDLRVMRSLADQLAIALRNAQLYGEQQALVEKLRTLDQMKSQFLASVSHELRTPLNAVLNFTEFVRLGMLGEVNEKQVDALKKVTDSGNLLLSLINDVLDITKIEAGMMHLFVEDNIDIRAEVDAILPAVQTVLGNKPVELTVSTADSLPVMVGDKRRIKQILLNLLSNAAKFTEQGSIVLEICQQDDTMLFSVRDTGPGIHPDHHRIIFEPFEQAEQGKKHAVGTGLGLPISLRLAQAHGGNLWLQSDVDQGSAFFVSLPIRSQTLIHLMEGVHNV